MDKSPVPMSKPLAKMGVPVAVPVAASCCLLLPLAVAAFFSPPNISQKVTHLTDVPESKNWR